MNIEVENECSNCGNNFSIGQNPNGCNLKRIYCGSLCKDSANKKRARQRRKSNPEYFVDKRRKEWEATKSNPKKLTEKRAQDRKNVSKVRQWLVEYKLKNGCADCGYKEHFSALQLDHEGFKSVSISDARSSVKRLKKEIEEGKCVVRCANCHSIITWKRKVGLV